MYKIQVCWNRDDHLGNYPDVPETNCVGIILDSRTERTPNFLPSCEAESHACGTEANSGAGRRQWSDYSPECVHDYRRVRLESSHSGCLFLMTDWRASVPTCIMLFNTSRMFMMASELQWLLGNGSICWSVEGRETCDEEDGVSDGVKLDKEEEKEFENTMGTDKGASEEEEAIWLGGVIKEYKDCNISNRSLSRTEVHSCMARLSCCGCSWINSSRLKLTTAGSGCLERLSTPRSAWVLTLEEDEELGTVKSRISSKGVLMEGNEGKEMHEVGKLGRLGGGKVVKKFEVKRSWKWRCANSSLCCSSAWRCSWACCSWACSSFSRRRCFTSASILTNSWRTFDTQFSGILIPRRKREYPLKYADFLQMTVVVSLNLLHFGY